MLELLDQGAHVIASNDLYGGAWRLFHRVRERTAGLKITHVDASDAAAVEAAITPETRLIWIETPAIRSSASPISQASPKSASGAASSQSPTTPLLRPCSSGRWSMASTSSCIR